jgi:hypothetical protein
LNLSHSSPTFSPEKWCFTKLHREGNINLSVFIVKGYLIKSERL